MRRFPVVQIENDSSSPLSQSSLVELHRLAPPALSSTQAAETGKLCLEMYKGNSEVLPTYLAQRTYDFSALPAWFRDRCWRVAADTFEADNTHESAMARITFSLSIRLHRPVFSFICRNILRTSPGKRLADIKKNVLAEETVKNMRPRLGKDHYEQLAIPETATLGHLVHRIESNFSDNDPEISTPAPRRLSHAEAMKVFSETQDIEDMRIAIGALIPFSPFTRGKAGDAPRAAYTEIARLLIAYSVLSDLLDVLGIELNAKRGATLFERLHDKPVDQWRKDPALMKLIELSQEISQDPSLTQYVSRLEAFSKYALQENPAEQLRKTNAARAALADSMARTLGAGEGEQENLLLPSSLNSVDQLVGSIEALLDAHEIEADDKEINPLYIARLAARRHFPFEKLKRIMESCDFDNAAIIAALKPEEKITPTEQPQGNSGSFARLSPLPLDDLPALSVLIHSEDGKEPFTAWFDDLRDKKRQESVTKALTKLRDGHMGDTKHITSKKVDGSVVGLYELKIKECGLRVYFRYVNNNRVILLGAGGKANSRSQDRDITRSAARAALYNGRGRDEAAQLREWSGDERNADQS